MKRNMIGAVVLAIAASLALPGAALAQAAGGTTGGTTTGGGPTTTGGIGTGAPTPVHPQNEIDLPVGAPLTGFELPPDKPSEDDPPKLYDEDIPTKTDSLVYVLDISGSMDWDSKSYTGLDGNQHTGPRIDRAKCELIKSIQALPRDFYFNVMAYDCDLYVVPQGKQKAEPGPKAAAIAWITSLQCLGATGTGPATAAGLADKNNFTVILLSDGDPNCGASGHGGHLRMIQAANTQRAVIHTFGIAASGSLEQFMRDIASTSGGRYYPVP